MVLFRTILLGCFLLSAANFGFADGKDKAKTKFDAAKLVGTWTFVKTTSKHANDFPPGTVLSMSITKDGKFTTSMTVNGKTTNQPGTYTVSGDESDHRFEVPEGDREDHGTDRQEIDH